MESTTRPGTVIAASSLGRFKGKSSVYKNMFESPGSYAFVQAVDLIQASLRRQGLAGRLEPIRFKVNPNLSFPASDIEDIVVRQGEASAGYQVEMTMNLMGLHGAASPLPAYFTEHVAIHQDSDDSLRDFFDIFNHKLITILYRTWRKYRYHLHYEEGAKDKYSQRFFSFIGMGFSQIREAKTLNWSRLLAYMGLIAFKGDATGSLESTLRHYFNHQDLHIIPCIKRRVSIPKDQQSRLGEANSILGRDFLIGEEVQDQTGKFRISIAHLTWNRFNSFLPDQPIFSELTSLIKTILQSRLQFDVELKLRPEEIRPFHIGRETVNRLGWSTWLGESGDGIVLLEQASTEM